jgi:hypothetical protein
MKHDLVVSGNRIVMRGAPSLLQKPWITSKYQQAEVVRNGANSLSPWHSEEIGPQRNVSFIWLVLLP